MTSPALHDSATPPRDQKFFRFGLSRASGVFEVHQHRPRGIQTLPSLQRLQVYVCSWRRVQCKSSFSFLISISEIKDMVCRDAENSCQRSTCECDREFIKLGVSEKHFSKKSLKWDFDFYINFWKRLRIRKFNLPISPRTTQSAWPVSIGNRSARWDTARKKREAERRNCRWGEFQTRVEQSLTSAAGSPGKGSVEFWWCG